MQSAAGGAIDAGEGGTGPLFVPLYVGRNGWIGIRLDRTTDWHELPDLIDRSWHMTAPKRLADPARVSSRGSSVRVPTGRSTR